MTGVLPAQLRARLVPRENRDGSTASGWGRGAPGFWNKVHKREDGCWDWTGYLDRDGAGKFCTRVDGAPKTFRAATFAWLELVGEVPAGHVLFSVVCGNTKCVNPDHRMAIPKVDVVRWIVALGRPIEHADNRGELSTRARLDAEAVLFIRSQPARYGLIPLLAKLYGVSPVTITKIRARLGWKHLGNGNKQNAVPLKQLRALVAQRAAEQLRNDSDFVERASARAEESR